MMEERPSRMGWVRLPEHDLNERNRLTRFHSQGIVPLIDPGGCCFDFIYFSRITLPGINQDDVTPYIYHGIREGRRWMGIKQTKGISNHNINVYANVTRSKMNGGYLNDGWRNGWI